MKRSLGGGGGPPKRFYGAGGGPGGGMGPRPGQGVEPEDEEEAMLAMGMEEVEEMEEVGEMQPPEEEGEAAGEASEATLLGDTDMGHFRAKWSRPAVEEGWDPAARPLRFQQMDLDYYVGPAHPDMVGQGRTAAIVRAFGVTAEGQSVCVHVHGFRPYFYVEAPPDATSPAACEAFRVALDGAVRAGMRGRGGADDDVCVVSVEVEQKMSLMYYRERKTPFLKITTGSPAHVAPARGALERGGVRVPSIPSIAGGANFVTYESNVLYALRFMIDRDVVGGGWMELPAGAYSLRTGTAGPKRKQSECQLEAEIWFDKLIAHAPEGQWSKLAPFRVLSFDIECAARKGHFPDATLDPVIQIAAMVTLQGEQAPLHRLILCLNTCSAIVGTDVMCFGDERELLKAFRDLVRYADPDVLTGYNIVNFDLPYLLDRADALGIPEFKLLSRVAGMRVSMKDTTFSSKAYGTRESKEINMLGRVQFDMMQAIQRDYKLSSYSLNAVSYHFLGEQKEDVHHSIISDLQSGNADTRRRLAVYCLKDAYLPQRLLDKLMYMYNYVEMARVTGVPLSFLLGRGQMIKVLSQLMRNGKTKGMLVPNLPHKGGPGDGEVAFEGATVLEAKAGYYQDPIATLDFASLYPSIMQAHNLCYTTLVQKHEEARVEASGVKTKRTPLRHLFVDKESKKGILPEILEELLSARKRAKADLKKATDPLERAVLDGRQLALKVSANSVYGFTGATVGKLPCLEISASVTAFGREMIEATKGFVEEHYTVANGYDHDAVVVYGDTDSVMIKFGCPLEESLALGAQAAELITDKLFIAPIRLEFEKVYFPYLLMNKKRYAGLLWTRPEKYDKMDVKGIETVRRDNCLLVRDVIGTCLKKCLVERDVAGAIAYAKNSISDLLTNKLDISLLVISKGLTKSADQYDNKTAHVELAERMRKRDPATAPNVGDRVAYVIVKGAKGAKAFEKAEDPMYVLDHNIPIDNTYYLENQLKQPLERVFEPIMKNTSELFHGEHTRKLSISTPSAMTGGIMAFAVKQTTCMACKSVMSASDLGESKTLCRHCRGRTAEIYGGTVKRVSALESDFHKLWSQCQRCQGSLHQEVLCTSRDCPIFYRRKKTQKELEAQRKKVELFADSAATLSW